MGPKKTPPQASAKPKKTLKKITVEVKKEIIEKHERGVRLCDLASQYEYAKSTIATILKNKEAIKGACVAKGVSVLSKQRSQAIEEVEKLLLIWINEKQIAGDSVSEGIIAEKALQLHSDIIKRQPGSSSSSHDFKASHGWFEKFKRRTGIHNVIRHGEAASADDKAAEAYKESFTKVGVVTALINFNLRHTPLIHSVQVADSKALICGRELQDALQEVKDELKIPMYVSGCGNTAPQVKDAKNMDQLLSASDPTPPLELDKVDFFDKMLYIYTSGTTGLPKAAIIKHARYLFFCTAAHHMAALTEEEIIYNPLPLYHTAGGMVGMGQVLVFNCTAVIRRKFSASQFWIEAGKHNCTVGQYVGELCRYLLNTPPKPEDTQHKVRVMFGNGVRAQIWEQFTSRFNMPTIAEFYGATEGIANIMNIDGKPGACGFVPVILRHVIPVYLIKVNEETGEPLRDKNGLCIMCEPGEPGEFVGMIRKNDPLRDFHGYADRKATQKKIVQDVWKKGDAAFKSGDILVMDEFGYMYFKDRTGDTFRWRGENVSSTEVEGVVSKVAGNKDAVVYGVEVPGAEGKAGMAAIVDPDDSTNLTEFLTEIKKNLPTYACPLFLRILKTIDATGTFKLKKLALQKEAFDRNLIKDALYFLDGKQNKYVELTPELFVRISEGKAGL